MSLTQEQIRTIDQLRQRLSALSASMQSLKADLERGQPLPTPNSIQQSAQMLAHNQSQVQELLSANRQFFTSAHSYPLPKFPGHTQEGLITELMRKKLDPRAEAWLDRYSHGQQPAQADQSSQIESGDIKELWNWAGPTSNDMLRKFVEDGVFDDDFTIEERETGTQEVVTGLKRKLDSDSEDVDEDPDGDQNMDDAAPANSKEEPGMDPSKPPMAMDSLLKFLSTGTD